MGKLFPCKVELQESLLVTWLPFWWAGMPQLTCDLQTTGGLLCYKAKCCVLCLLLSPFAVTNFIYLHKKFIFYLLIFTDFTKLCPFPFAFPLFFPFIYYSIFQALLFNLCCTHYFSLKYPFCKMSQPISHPQSQRSSHSENTTSANPFLQTLPVLLTIR